MKNKSNVTFRSSTAKEYYRYNTETKVMTILIVEECDKGIVTRCEQSKNALFLNFLEELKNGVPSEYRLYESVEDVEWDYVTDSVVAEITKAVSL